MSLETPAPVVAIAPDRVFDGDPSTPAVMPNAFASVLALM